jgi:fatty-acyl-CoA synthase
MMANCVDYVSIWLGLTGVGIVVALINNQLRDEGLKHCVSIAGVKRLIVDGPALSAARACACVDEEIIWLHGEAMDRSRRVDLAITTLPSGPLAEDERHLVKLRDLALLIYTSGTTGLPKAAHVSHFRVMMWSEWFAGVLDARPEDRLYNCLPMYHSVGGVVAVGSMLVSGGAVLTRKTFSVSRFWTDVATSGATLF